MSAPRKVSHIKSEVLSPISAKTVLIVEDDLCCSMSLQMILESSGCKVLSGNTCIEAFSLLRKNQKAIDLILLDITMPDKNGIDFLVEARSKNILRGIPVVIQSAEGRETIQRALDKGACGYVHKPYIKEEISRVITNLSAKH